MNVLNRTVTLQIYFVWRPDQKEINEKKLDRVEFLVNVGMHARIVPEIAV